MVNQLFIKHVFCKHTYVPVTSVGYSVYFSGVERIKDVEFHTQVKDIHITYFGSIEEHCFSINNEKLT
jgi:hypothetical protein